jgi:hypothetical protein
MAQLTLGDLKLGLKDLFENKDKKKLLAQSKAGALYAPMLDAKRQAIDALPPAVVDTGRPLADQLTAADGLHDGYGKAIWFLSESYRALPDLDSQLRDAIGAVQAQVIGSLGELKKAYAVEAAAAVDRAKVLPKIKADLKLFPVAGNGTLFDWVAAFTRHGEKLHELLAQRGAARAGAEPTPAGKEILVLRNETVGLLGRARAALADEVEHDPKLPRNLEAQVFGYFDELLAMRAAQEAAAARTGGDVPPGQEPPPGGAGK